MRWWLLLAAAGAYAAEPGYVAPGECRPCHRAIFDAYQTSGMARSFRAVRTVPEVADFFHAGSERHYSVVQRGSSYFLRRWQEGRTNIIEKSMDYAVGSGNHSETYLHRESGGFVELPLSWYAEGGGQFAMSPGYDRPDHSDFRREVPDSCLFCHNGYPSDANRGIAQGIDCQRCHGPGEAHIRRRGPIVNPAKLSAERRMDVCLQCHLESASRTLPDAVRRFGRPTYSFRPGERLSDYMLYFQFSAPPMDDRITVNNGGYGLMRSKCFLKSEGRLGCTTCHDSHAGSGGPAAESRYTAACRSCHGKAHDAATRDCAGCHMPKRRTEDAVHVVMTDHLIRRVPFQGNATAPLEEQHDRVTGPVQPLYPARLPATPDAKLSQALAQMSVSANPRQDLRVLERAITAARPESFEPYAALATAYQKTGRVADSVRAWRQALEKSPHEARLIAGCAEALTAAGRSEEATALLETAADGSDQPGALNARRWHTTMLNMLAVLYGAQQRFGAALTLLTKAVQESPDDPTSWLNLGVCLQARGDRSGAEAAYERALVLQPDLRKATENLNALRAGH